jgi:hypothetical protein
MLASSHVKEGKGFISINGEKLESEKRESNNQLSIANHWTRGDQGKCMMILIAVVMVIIMR